MSFNALAGHIASVTVNASNMAFDRVELVQEQEFVRSDNVLGNNAAFPIPGTLSESISCSGPFDQGNMNALAINQLVTLVVTFNTGISISIYAYVKSCRIVADIGDAQRIESQFITFGSFSLLPI